MKPVRFLFTTWEGGGNVAPALTLARKLTQRGHAVRVMSDEANRREAESAGATFIPWSLAPNRPDRTPQSCPVRDWEATNPVEGVGKMMHGIMFGPALAYAQDVMAELRREPADLVVSSEMLPGVMAGCEALDQPLALFTANLCFYPIPGMPTFGPGLPPARNDEERTLHAQISAGNTAMFDSGLPAINAARRVLGLPLLEHALEQVQAARAILLGTSRAFDFPSQPPGNVTYVGPQLDEPAWAASWTPPRSREPGRRLVAVGFSTTFQNHTQVLQTVIDATSTLPVHAIVTLAGIPSQELRTPENVTLLPSAPHDALMRESAVVVTHGGHGTVNRALIHRRPLLIIPHGRDQNENAVRVTERGAGLSLPPHASAEEIREAMRRLLEDPSFTEAARKLGDAIAAEMEHSPAVTQLEELAGAVKVMG